MLILLFTRPADSSNLRGWSSISRMNYLIRLKGKRAGYLKKLNLINSSFQEDRARDCQEIEELRRLCSMEADRARQLKLDELSMQQKENHSTVNQLLAQIQEIAR